MKSTNLSKSIVFSVTLVLPVFAQYPQLEFPLQVGNLWQYTEGPGFYSNSQVIRDTMMANGLAYAQVTGAYLNGFFRQEGPKLLQYNPSSNTETVRYDFSRKPNDTMYVVVSGADSVVKTIYSSGTQTILGQQRACMAFLTKHTQTTLFGIDYVADGIGLYSYNGEVFAYGLSGAIINGVKFGTVLQVFETSSAAPVEYQLYQNYPNPFNPETSIPFNLSKSGYASIQVFDQLGRSVTTLISRTIPPGSHFVKWNAANSPSGVYFYRLEFGSSVETKQMLLVK